MVVTPLLRCPARTWLEIRSPVSRILASVAALPAPQEHIIPKMLPPQATSAAQVREALKQELIAYGLRQGFVEEVLRSMPNDDLPFADVHEYVGIKLAEHTRNWDKYGRDQGGVSWDYEVTREFCAAAVGAECFASEWLADIVYLDRQ